MSYNIDNWKTKKLKALEVPLSAFKQYRADWHPEIERDAEMPNSLTLHCGCGQEIKGVEINTGKITVTDLDMDGEGSGVFYREVFLLALKQSTGELEAVLIWEGGDSINRLIVKDGDVKEEKVEL